MDKNKDTIVEIVRWMRKQPMPEMETDPVYIIPEFWRQFCYLDGDMDFHWHRIDDIISRASFADLRRACGELIAQANARIERERQEMIQVAKMFDEIDVC